jgi:hypothetical protein
MNCPILDVLGILLRRSDFSALMAAELTRALPGGKRGGHHGFVLFRFILTSLLGAVPVASADGPTWGDAPTGAREGGLVGVPDALWAGAYLEIGLRSWCGRCSRSGCSACACDRPGSWASTRTGSERVPVARGYGECRWRLSGSLWVVNLEGTLRDR